MTNPKNEIDKDESTNLKVEITRAMNRHTSDYFESRLHYSVAILEREFLSFLILSINS
jgi:hypothetical protein